MAEIERVQRPFWIHQIVEYLVGIGLISASVQLPDPAVPALLGLLIILNAAVAKGSAGAFRLVGRRLHRTLDLVVIAVLVFFAVQPWLSIDGTGRLLIGAIAFILCFVWFYTDFAEQRTRAERRAERAARGPRDSHEMGRQAGRVAANTVNSLKRWKEGIGADESAETPRPASSSPSAPSSPWDPPKPGTPAE
jgi:Ca2+/Na+ antiporter